MRRSTWRFANELSSGCLDSPLCILCRAWRACLGSLSISDARGNISDRNRARIMVCASNRVKNFGQWRSFGRGRRVSPYLVPTSSVLAVSHCHAVLQHSLNNYCRGIATQRQRIFRRNAENTVLVSYSAIVELYPENRNRTLPLYSSSAAR